MNDIDRDQLIRKNYSSVRRISDLNGDNEVILDINGNVVIVDESLLQAEYEAKQYQRDRQYPPIGDQLDEIYHNGIDEWKKTIKKVKDAHPKPE